MRNRALMIKRMREKSAEVLVETVINESPSVTVAPPVVEKMEEPLFESVASTEDSHESQESQHSVFDEPDVTLPKLEESKKRNANVKNRIV